ncbi:MAG: BolA family transcriptional regulator [Rhodospirillales bacterium]|nr:BolA family transcriptional regulator [Rhodospirillales bacterium]
MLNTILSVAERMELLLREAFSPSHLEVIDESALHAGHAGANPGGESHFRVVIVSDRFAETGRVQRQQLVYGVLDEMIKDGIHALSMVTSTPEEYADR